jgi:ParB/RepB/Spo0J family partition protein
MAAAPKLQNIDIEKIDWQARFRTNLGDIDGLTESIREKGILQPITVSPNGSGSYNLLAGERRVTAAINAGLNRIPALIRTIEDTADAREIELFENVFRKDFDWDERVKLVAEIDKLNKAKNADWSLRKTAQYLGFGAATVSRQLQLAAAVDIMPELAIEFKTEAEAFKALKKYEEQIVVSHMRTRQEKQMDKGERDFLVRASSNYEVGNTLEQIKRLKTNGLVHFIECDPPYGIDLPNIKRDSVSAITYQEIEAKEYKIFLTEIAEELYRVANRDSWMIFWFGPTHFTLVKETLEEVNWTVCAVPGIWVKGTGQTQQPNINLANCYEPFFICRKGNPVLMKQGRSNVFQFASVAGTQKYHPTERPLALMDEMLEIFTAPNNIVLIPFLGSGVTLRACYLNGRLGFGWDIDSQYKDKFMLAVEDDMRKLNATGE